MRRLCFVLLLVLVPSLLPAQELVALKKETQRFADPTENVDDLIVEIRDNLFKELLLVADAQDKSRDLARLLAFSRGDLQSGATSGASGSTTTVVSPLLPAIFGVAIEQGAITRTVSGTTITLKANPAGLVCVSRSDSSDAVALRDRSACRTFWNRVGVTASFDTSRGEKNPELADLKTVSSQLSELVVRFELLNRRDVTFSRVATVARPFLAKAEALGQGERALAPLVEGAKTRVERELTDLVHSAPWAGSTGEVRKTMVEQIVRKVVTETTLPAAQAAQVRALWLESLEAYAKLEEAIAGAAVVTLDYSLQRADLAAADLAGGVIAKGVRPPDLHVARLVFAKSPLANLDMTSNASVAFFGEKREGMPSHLRDVRVGVEAKFKLRTVQGYGRPTLSFAGLYAYLNQEPLGLEITGVNGADITQRGHIGVFQTKLELPAAKNGVRIPLSLTFSNRTELIKESDVRGQIGVSFNLDSLFAAAK